MQVAAMKTQQQQQQHPADETRMEVVCGTPEKESRRVKNQEKGRKEDAFESEAVRRRRLETCKTVTKEVAKKAVLYAVMVIYAILGGYVFVALEQTNEKELCSAHEDLYNRMESAAALSLWKMSRSFLDADEADSQMELVQRQVTDFRDNVLTLSYDGRNCSSLGTANGTAYSWNLASALLFSVTIFTTVGYGNITPQTVWGRLVCIAYAMCGIPLMFVCLASIGEILGDVFRFVYFKICCLGACKRRHRSLLSSASQPTPADGPRQSASDDKDSWKQRLVDDNDDDDDECDEDEMSIPITVTLLVIAGYIGLGTIMFANWEGWDAMKGAYYCFITIATIGFGDVVPGFTSGESGAALKMIVAALYLLFGMSLMSMAFDLIQYEMKNRVPSRSSPADGKDESSPDALQGNRGGLPLSGQPVWSDGKRAHEAMSVKASEMTTSAAAADASIGVKKRGLHAGKDDGLKATKTLFQCPPAEASAKLDLKNGNKVA